MRLLSIVMIILSIALLMSGCGTRKLPSKQIPAVADLEIKEVADEDILEDDSDLDVPVEVVSEVDPPQIIDKPKTTLNLDGLDLGLGESIDEDIPEDDVEELD